MSVKFSSLPTYSEQPYPFPDLTAGLRGALDAFGSERIMWASDITRMHLLDAPPTYAQVLDRVRVALDFLTPAERDDILGGTALRILGWPGPGR